MIATIRNAWKIPELRKKILFTLFVLLIFRLGNAVPVPFVNAEALGYYFEQLGNTVLGLYNVMSGDAFSNCTIFALSIQPYINASIIIQLLTIAIPALERMQRDEGEEGRKKITSITRYTTVGIGLLQGFGYYMLMKNQYGILTDNSAWAAVVIIATFIAGASFIMWMGEQITEFGIGNGISMILFAGIVARGPTMLNSLVSNYGVSINFAGAVGILVGALAMIVFIVFSSQAERRIPVQYAKRVVGRKMYGGQSTHLPIKVNMSGVLPIIFAQTIAMLPATIAALVNPAEGSFGAKFLDLFDTTSTLYIIIYFLLIIGFSFFYASVQFNPVEIANNLRKNGGFIPGFRPGKPTSEFIHKVLNKVTFFGSIYLGVVAIVPLVFTRITGLSSLGLGGTSIVIVVGVALETVQQMEAQMVMRNYKGFLE
ncbi:MAG: preprotein translocase subunit SecY [Oscillospiraceae bacterium]